MKLTAQIQLNTTSEQYKILLNTLAECNNACNKISSVAWTKQVFNQYALHKEVYHPIRKQFNLSAQSVVRCISKVSDSYKQGKHKQRKFREYGSIAYDHRILRFKQDDKVSIWTTGGRQVISYSLGERQKEMMKYQNGESDLCLIDNKFYLLSVCDIPDVEEKKFVGIIGVDVGVKNIATLNTGKNFSASEILKVRHRNRKLRQKLQKIGTKSSKRLLKNRNKKEKRFAKNINHIISKKIVSIAKRHNSAIAIEKLKGIRQTVTVRRKQKATLHSWSFFQLHSFIRYKAKLIGIKLFEINPKYTSQRCYKCGYIAKNNRRSQSEFVCKSCDHKDNADVNGAKNIAFLARLMSTSQTQEVCFNRLTSKLPA